MIAVANALATVGFVLLAFAPLILIALLVNSIRKNNAKRRAFEQKRQADQFAAAVSAAMAERDGAPALQAVAPAPAPIPWWRR